MAQVRRGRALRPPIATVRRTFAIGIALVVALGGLNLLLANGVWWIVSSIVAVITLAAMAAVRAATRRELLPLVGGPVALVATTTLFFAADTAVLGVIPTFDTVGRFGDLLASGAVSIQEQGVPAEPVPGILFILSVASGLVAIALDAFANVAKAPALTGIPLLAVVAAPGFINPDYTDPIYFVLTGAAWLFVLYVSSSRAQPAVAVVIGGVAVVAALVLPIALPPVVPVDTSASGEGYATGLNPIIDLGEDLRRDSPVLAATYTTTSEERQYLRMATLDDFEEGAWQPSIGSGNRSLNPEDIATAPGRDAEVAVSTTTTNIKIGNVRGRWLPVPYAPRSVTGLVGTWVWDPETLNVRTERSSVRGQEYVVTTEAADPTSDQLRSADPIVQADFERYLRVPETLPENVAATALAATAGAETNYDKAIALQSFFRGGDFTYSEEAPVENGYDGTSAAVIGTFLDERRGYCVHFSSAMAAMARTLGIPARVAVGFTTGTEVDNQTTGEEEFRVTTDELHAWPELYFNGVGWIRFEPTVGRSNVPEYNPAVQDDPATPDIDESTAAPGSTGAPQDVAPERDDSGGAAGSEADTGPNWNAIILSIAAVALLAVLAIPAIARVVRRRARVHELAHRGSAVGAWDEVRDTALDLGWRLTESETPREFAARLSSSRNDREFAATGPIGGSPIDQPEAVAALERLRSAVEHESFARAGDGRASGAEAAGATTADLREVLAALRGGVDRGVRLRAALAPASILARWFAVGVRWTGQG